MRKSLIYERVTSPSTSTRNEGRPSPPWPSTRTETAWNLLPFALMTSPMSLPTIFARTEPPATSRRQRSAHLPSFPNLPPLSSRSASPARYEFTRYYMSPNWSPNTPTRSTTANSRPQPLIVDGDPEYLIERILDSEYNRVRRKCQL